jgi:hypothetical protein
MSLYKNTSGQRRVWPRIQLPGAGTLELDADEKVELDLPDDFNDVYLQPVLTKKEQAEQKKADKAQASADAEAQAAADDDNSGADDTDSENDNQGAQQ